MNIYALARKSQYEVNVYEHIGSIFNINNIYEVSIGMNIYALLQESSSMK